MANNRRSHGSLVFVIGKKKNEKKGIVSTILILIDVTIIAQFFSCNTMNEKNLLPCSSELKAIAITLEKGEVIFTGTRRFVPKSNA
jgi:hypothetical protein